MRLWKRLLRRFRRDGILPTLRGLLNVLKPLPYGFYSLTLSGGGQHLSSEMADVGADVQSDPERLVSLLRAFPNVSFPWEEFGFVEIRHKGVHLELSDRAKQAYFIWAGNRPGAVVWVHDMSRNSRFVVLRAREAELAGLFVSPEHRSRGWAKALIRQACHDLGAQGYRTLYAAIADSNIPSRRAFTAAGFRPVASAIRPTRFGPRFVSKGSCSEGWLTYLVKACKRDSVRR